jgi:hypothetical protein
LRNYIDIFDAAILRFLLNRNGEIIDVNVGFLELFGGVKDDFLRRNFLQFVSKNSREAISEKWTNFQRGEDEMYDLLFPCVVEYKEVWLSMRFVRFFDTIVNQEQFILIGVNVDSFKRAEIDASRKLKAISSSTLYATVLPSGELGAKRDFFTKGLGYDYEALNGKKTVDIIPADNELAIHWVRLYNGFPFSRVENHKTVFGHEKWFYISYIPILDEHDVLLEIILFASDVSENKLALVKEQTNVTALESELNRFQDIELEFSLLQARFKKQKKEFDFMREQTNLLIKQETVIFEKQKEDFKQEIGSLFAKINELELTKNIMKLNYEKQINNLSKIFEEDRKKMNRRILRLESEIETLLGQQRIVKN